MDIYTKEGLDKLDRKLDGIVLTSVNTTAVEEKDIPKLPEPTYHNAPEDEIGRAHV